MDEQKKSVFAQFAWKFIERGIPVIPIAPGSKKPGQYDAVSGWRGMADWTRFCDRMPSELELQIWETWPDAGIGVPLGKTSGITCLDKDYDVPGAGDALDALIPYSPVAKKGEKGWTKFYRYNGERSCSFNVSGKRILDVLSDGRQTVVPPTAHPSGCNYVWITLDTLDSIDGVLDLPQLPSDFLEQVEKVLAPYQTPDDTKYQRKNIAPQEDDKPIVADSMQAEYFRELNQVALANLDLWVPKIIPTARPDKDGFRCIATWRMAKNHNVGINPRGIVDFGGGYGMTPIDLVIYANGLTFPKAVDVLRPLVPMNQQEVITFAAAAKSADPASAASVPSAPKLMPWQTPAVPAIILPPTEESQIENVPTKAIPQFVLAPPGILSDIANWIVSTAPKAQPELATAAAIALAATVMQRIYRSNWSNFTSLYLLLVAKSTEGKEHPQSCVEQALTAADLGHLVAGSGYTSSGAVFSALLRQPSHLATIDEFGKLLKLSRSKGNANSEAAIDKLVEAFGKLNGVMRPPVYSTMTMSGNASQPGDRMVYNPAITMLGATTPATFYGALTDDLVSDGFLGRLIVAESSLPRREARFINQTDPPARVIEWLKAVHTPGQRQGNLADKAAAEIPAVVVEMEFSSSCEAPVKEFERELNDLKDRYESERLDVLLGRSAEKAMRLAMIAAKARDVSTLRIEMQDIEWAIAYVRHHDIEMVRSVRKNRVRNQTDEDTKKAISYIKGAKSLLKDHKNANYAAVLAAGAMPHSLLLKRMHMKSREFTELMNTAVEAALVTKCPGAMFNYAGDVYFASED